MYKCEECKDKKYIVLFTSTVECQACKDNDNHQLVNSYEKYVSKTYKLSFSDF